MTAVLSVLPQGRFHRAVEGAGKGARGKTRGRLASCESPVERAARAENRPPKMAQERFSAAGWGVGIPSSRAHRVHRLAKCPGSVRAFVARERAQFADFLGHSRLQQLLVQVDAP